MGTKMCVRSPVTLASKIPEGFVIGAVFHRLTITKLLGFAQHGILLVECLCYCGQTTTVTGSKLKLGKTKSCGCFHRQCAKARRFRHGYAGTKIYSLWLSMLDRCRNPNNSSYPWYGGRGITVIPRWSDFINFLTDMGKPPLRHSLDRVDNNGNYGPDNCEWKTHKQQCQNTRINVNITFNNKTQCISAWADELGVNRTLIGLRLRKGWSVEQALTTPPREIKYRMLEIAGEVKRLSDWMKISPCQKGTIKSRLALGWTPEEAVFTPPGILRHKNK